MKTETPLLFEQDSRGVVTLTLNRPEVHNAFDDLLIGRLIQALEVIENDPDARVLLLRSSGKNFSAGADLQWMRSTADFSPQQNRADAKKLAQLMHLLNHLDLPTIVQIQGATYGGGVGLVACCDIAIASDNAYFCLSEVRLGLIPAVISPYVVAAIGERSARRYFQSAEKFDASEARRIGLVHEKADPEQLDDIVAGVIAQLLKGGPLALAAAKHQVLGVAGKPVTSRLIKDSVELISALRASDEGKEGVDAFLQNRRPHWLKDED